MATGKKVATYTKHDNVVVAAAISPDGRLVATAGGNAYPIHIWETRTGQGQADARGHRQEHLVGGLRRDGKTITWGTTPHYVNHNARGPLELQLRLPNAKQSLGQPEPVVDPQNFVRAFTTYGAYSLMHRKGGDFGYDAFLDIQKDGKTVASIERDPTSGYGHWSYSFTPDGQTIVSGDANGTIQAYDLTGKKIGDFIGHQSVIWALAPSADGRYLISGAGDQTVRLWNLQDARADRHAVPRRRRRMGDVDPAGLLHGLARRRHHRRLADEQGPRELRPTTSAPISCART